MLSQPESDPPDLRRVLEQFAPLDGLHAADLPVQRLSGGLINDTFALGEHWVLQRLHRIFTAEVNLDIAALVPPLLAAEVTVPELRLARDGRPWVDLGADTRSECMGVWRILTRLPGDTLHRLEHAGQARSAARLVARFHGGLAQVRHDFAFTRPGAHDTDRHMAGLVAALDTHRGHRLYDSVAPLGEELLRRWQTWGTPPALPTRIVHGDLKVSNLLFEKGEATAVLDLDTMAHGTLDIELGDALRSWCNSGTEDDVQPRFDAEIFAEALAGYLDAAESWVTQEELAALPSAVERICLELAARFAADALNETYFGWDAQRFPARGEHDLARAQNQLGLGRDVSRQRSALEKAVPRL